MSTTLRGLLLGCLFIAGAFGWAGPGRPTAFEYGRAHGLPQVGIQDVFQDAAGRYWVSTFSQLFVGDGYRFTSVRLPAATQAQDGLLQGMVLDESGTPWICTDAGVFAWDGHAFTPRATPPLPRHIRNLQASRDGHLWLWAERALMHRPPGGAFSPVEPPLAEVPITAIAPEFRGSGLVLCQNTRLWRFRPDGSWEALPDIPGIALENSLGTRGELPILGLDGEGLLWAQFRHRILTLAPSGQAWQPIPYHRATGGDPDFFVGRILSDGAFWLAEGPGFVRGWRNLLASIPGPEDRTFYGLAPLLLDREGHLWWSDGRLVRLKGRGLWHTHGPASGLPRTEIWQFQEHRNTLWVGTGEGLFHQVDGRWARVGPAQRTNQLAVTEDGSLWVRATTQNNLWRLAPGASWLETFQGEGIPPGTFITRMTSDGRSLYLLTRDRRGLRGALTRGRWTFMPWPLPPSTRTRGAQSLSADPSGRIWLLGQQSRPLIWNGNTWESVPGPEIPSAIAMGFTPTGDSFAVVSYNPLGVNLYRLEGSGIAFQAALPVREVMGAQLGYGSLFDRQGRLWITTDAGVARCTFTPSLRIDAFSEDEGLPSADCDQHSLFEDRAGRIYVGTNRGLAEFQSQLESSLPPLLAPTLLASQFNKAPLRPEAGRLALDERRGLLSLTFSLPTLALGETTRLQWRDLGTREPWEDLDRGSLNLQDPAAGRRRLSIRALVSGAISSPEFRLDLDIRPPLWRRPSAYAAYALGLFGLGWLVHSLRSRLLRARNAQLERIVSVRTADLAAANDQLAQASRAKSAFLADMSHELRTPLNAILLYAELIHEDALEREQGELAEDTGRIQGAGQHLLSLINGIMDLSKIEAGKLELRPVPVRLGTLLKEVAQVLEPLARQQGDDLQVACDLEQEEILADEVKLRQILLNLGGNAIKFTKAGRVTLRASHHEGWASLDVIDTGPGMSDSQLDRLFRAYEQPTQETKGYERVDGTGLGLTISRRLAQLMGGDLTVTSAVGVGTTFSLRVPRVTEARTT
ncbi:MAG: hypothetical protein HYZ13_02090 [Acidobacteria bacterium]|nr:hypothetical protein [Acidobacteriota bacterium]